MTLRTIFPRLLPGLVIVAGALWLALYPGQLDPVLIENAIRGLGPWGDAVMVDEHPKPSTSLGTCGSINPSALRCARSACGKNVCGIAFRRNPASAALDARLFAGLGSRARSFCLVQPRLTTRKIA